MEIEIIWTKWAIIGTFLTSFDVYILLVLFNCSIVSEVLTRAFSFLEFVNEMCMGDSKKIEKKHSALRFDTFI